MRLALTISSLDTGGAERILSELANYWVSKEHQVTLMVLSSVGTQPFYRLDSRIKLILLSQNQMKSSPIARLINILKRLFYLRRAIRNSTPDVIISFADVMNITTLIAAWGLSIPVIVSERTHPAYHQLPKIYKMLRTRLYPRAKYLVMQTTSSAAYFNGFSNLVVIPNRVRRPLHTKEFTEKKMQHIISVGRLHPVKGFDTLIQAFSKLLKNYPNLLLTIYGEGHARSDLENLISSLGLQGKVLLPGTTQNIYEALVQGDVFVFPSHYEGFPNALCEAMSVGLPVVASNCSGNIDILRDGIDGRIFPVGDANALAQVLRELLEDSRQLKELADHAKAICERFHPDAIFEQWDALISSCRSAPLS